jgi:hypothetical protein
MPKSEQARPLQNAIHHAAQEMGVSDHFAANLMSYVFEKIVAEVSKGEVVRIPGFGIFGAYGYVPRKPGLESYCLPSFAGSRAFRNELRECLPFEKNRNETLYIYRGTNHATSRAKSHTSRTFTAMKAFRTRVDAQARKLGIQSRPTEVLPG